jgi:tetratricopeptide (TPR) repeat protein
MCIKYIIYKPLKILLCFIFFCGCFGYKSQSPSINTFRSYSLAIDQYQSKNFDEALKYIDEAIASNNKIAQYYELKGDILSAKYEFKAALAEYEKSKGLRLTPAILLKTGSVLGKMDRYPEAVREYKFAYAQGPQQTEILLLLVNCFIQQKELELALNQLKDYKMTVEKQQKEINPVYYILSAKILFEKREYSNSVIQVEKATGPKNRNECIFYLRALFYTNNHEKAYKLVTNEYQNILTQADIHFFRGLYYVKNENHNVAKTQLELSVKNRSQIFEAYELLTAIYISENNSDLARETSEAGEKFRQDRLINIDLDI